ncbi:lactosylceramide 4-alpha-galactosyltransferase-like [Durio zibethinus]|uniref:Lactosylceramide 4-alpha-galactosyltransferase-like n=1 Tax=Durio zibethinus TaxID=66656 RepID=A0A6P5WWH6_DURZI|nr:lactosylceramide 4-alpha-galactosyltransferase-like [Durio zibethinus]
MFQMNKLRHRFRHIKSLVFGYVVLLPTSLVALSLLVLLACNGFSIFYISLPVPAKASPEPANLLPDNLPGDKTVAKLASSVMYAVKEENPPVILKTHLPLVQKPNLSMVPVDKPLALRPKQARLKRNILRTLRSGTKAKWFSSKVTDFFQNSKCKSRFFMTWISSAESLGDRELLAIESVFKSHSKACLVIVSNSLDSKMGSVVLKPFLDKGFQLIAVDPDFDYIFKNTHAELWFNRLKKGNVDPGEVSLGQNLSNLLRLALLYKYGGIYIDTDIIVLKSFNNLRNVIGAQSINLETKNWSRLNNAVLIFDKQHPLLYKFIQEFSLTFDGNKWGHNGPYLVSRVVARVTGRPGFNFTVLPPSAFYPVDWSRIRSLFRGPRNEIHSKWLHNKHHQIRRQSYAVHLWNRQSGKHRVQEGSIIHHIMSDICIFCNSSRSSL